MRILIVSDTHGKNENLKKALDESDPYDCLVHLGDAEETRETMEDLAHCPVYMVSGNCDHDGHLPLSRIEELDGYRILMTHGHAFFVSAGIKELKKNAVENGCSIAMFGHTHRPLIDQSDPDITILNPGSLTFPRQEGRRPSYILMETRPGASPLFTLKFL